MQTPVLAWHRLWAPMITSSFLKARPRILQDVLGNIFWPIHWRPSLVPFIWTKSMRQQKILYSNTSRHWRKKLLKWVRGLTLSLSSRRRLRSLWDKLLDIKLCANQGRIMTSTLSSVYMWGKICMEKGTGNPNKMPNKKPPKTLCLIKGGSRFSAKIDRHVSQVHRTLGIQVFCQEECF